MSAAENGPAPVLPHLTIEFYVWLWYASERDGGTMDLGEEAGICDVWVEERLSFRPPDEDRARAVLTGENASGSLEARAALASGKVVKDLQMHLRRDEREYTVTLRGPHLDLAGAKLPKHASDGEGELLYERMYLYEELWFLVRALYVRFAGERTASTWHTTVLPAIREWVQGGEAGGDLDPALDEVTDTLDGP
jgi:hypothetical protein